MPNPRPDRHFATTQWSLVLAAGDTKDPQSRRALASLCEAYWYPLYAYIRRRGYSPHDAQDLTQAFFAFVLKTQLFEVADARRGRFRSFLLASLNNFLANHWRKESSPRRGGGSRPLSIDLDEGERRYAREPADRLTPERIFDRRWALTLLEQVLARLADEQAAAGRAEHFRHLKAYLVGESARPYRDVAAETGLTESAVKVAVHRLRKRFGQLLRAEIAETVAGPSDVDDEVRQMMEVLGS